MIHAQGTKAVVFVKPATVATNADGSGYTDTLGFDYLTIDFITDTFANTTNVPLTLKLSEADGTSYTDIVACTGGTATSTSVGFVWPTPSTAASQVFTRFHLDLRKRKRYIKATFRPGTAALGVAVHGDLSRAAEMPGSATEAGVAKLVIV